MSSKPLNWTAIAVGWAMRTFGGGVAGTIASQVVLLIMPTHSTASSSLAQRVLPLIIAGLVVNVLFSLWSGYLAGRIAECDEIKHAAIVGVLSFVVALLLSSSVLLRISLPQAAMQVFLSSLVVPFAIFGGAIAQLKRKPTLNSSQPHPFDPIPRV